MQNFCNNIFKKRKFIKSSIILYQGGVENVRNI